MNHGVAIILTILEEVLKLTLKVTFADLAECGHISVNDRVLQGSEREL